jgi:hypothetical protein
MMSCGTFLKIVREMIAEAGVPWAAKIEKVTVSGNA